MTYCLFADIIPFEKLTACVLPCCKRHHSVSMQTDLIWSSDTKTFMETFAVAAISLTISISLLIKKKKKSVHLSFALLCFALFLQKTGAFFYGIFNIDFWKIIDYLGILSIPPLLFFFNRFFITEKTFPKKIIVSTAFCSFLIVVALFTPLYRWPHLNTVLYLYIGSAMVYCYITLLNSIKEKVPGVEKKRMIYVATACAIAAAVSISDIFHHYGYGLPPLSNIAIAALIYFTLVIITYPHLPEFHEIMARALIIFVLILFAAIVFYLVAGLFGGDSGLPPINIILMTSFIIVIFIDPVKLILKKIVSYFFFEGRDVFTSLYTIDEKLESEKSVLLEEMATGLAHEIRNPLGSIKGAAQYLGSEADTAENRKLFDVIIEEVDRLSNVVSQFLNYAKPYTINAKKQNINHIIEKTTALIKADNLSDKIIIRKDLSSDLPEINVDGEQLMQVFLNIAYNGIEAMPEGGTLSFTTSKIEKEDGEIVEIAIRDTGRGINKEDIKNVFKPFFTTREKGTGLGLSICQRIITKHGGHIEARSYPGKSTVFYIRIRQG